MKRNRIRILVVDDHPALRLGLIAMIDGEEDMEVVAEAGDGLSAVEAFRQHRPDLTLLDLRMPGMSGVEVIEAIKHEAPGFHVVVLTTSDCEHDVSQALRAGAQSYLLKDAPTEELLAAIRAVNAGQHRISPAVAFRLADHIKHGEPSPRELDMLQHLVRGRSNREIAADLGLTEDTVKSYMRNLFAKLGVADRTQAVIRGLERGFVHLD
jgi:DNA-binding NarL/FixJ family response regulator